MAIIERLLEAHERVRPGRVLSSVSRRAPPDVTVGIEGFLPPRVAAEVMGLSLDELLSLVQRGLLEAEDVGERELWVRPAVVSVLSIGER